jgi:hypothetical protein
MYLLLLLPIIACSLVQGTIFDISNCPAGYFCLGKSITPIPCPVGTWSNAGAAQCTPCETGYYSAKAGSSYCTICEQGHFCDLKHLPPQPCPLGTYNDKLGKTQCIDCGSGTYTPKQALQNNVLQVSPFPLKLYHFLHLLLYYFCRVFQYRWSNIMRCMF